MVIEQTFQNLGRVEFSGKGAREEEKDKQSEVKYDRLQGRTRESKVCLN